jgi:hypothetical protein
MKTYIQLHARFSIHTRSKSYSIKTFYRNHVSVAFCTRYEFPNLGQFNSSLKIDNTMGKRPLLHCRILVTIRPMLCLTRATIGCRPRAWPFGPYPHHYFGPAKDMLPTNQQAAKLRTAPQLYRCVVS